MERGPLLEYINAKALNFIFSGLSLYIEVL